MRQRKRNCPSQASCCSRYQRHSPTQSKLRILHYLPSIACLLFPRPLFAGRSSIDDWTTTIRSELLPGKRGGLNGSTQHFLEVYSQESENLKFVVGVDLSAALLCSDPTGNSRLGLRSSGSIVVRARLCFRSSRVARDSADHKSRLSHPWPLKRLCASPTPVPYPTHAL